MMKIRNPKKQVAAGIAALLMVHCAQFGTVIADTTDPAAEAMTAVSTPAETEESEAESENMSSVTIVRTAETTEETYEATDWWKAGLTEYQDSFSLVSYEKVENPEGLTEEGLPVEGEATLIAQGGANNTIISSGQADSAVSSVQDGYFAFTTYGYGHGVGLSQNGANFYAKYGGWNYRDILFHYYPGTTLMNTGTAEKEIFTTQGVSGNVLMQVAEIVNREIGPSFHEEAIKAQAVAIYSYMKYYNNDSHDLKGKKNPSQKIIDCCAEVLGEALYYNGNFAMTMFYASSGGITANCSDVFSMDIPYLRSVAGDYDAAYDPHYGEVIYYSVAELRNKLQRAYGIKLSANPENWITIVEGNGGYVNKVIIDNQVTVRGNSFRAVMNFKSPKFTYICSADGEEIVETTPAPTEPISTTTASTAQTTASTTTAATTTAKETTTTVQTTTTVVVTEPETTAAPTEAPTTAAPTEAVTEAPIAAESPAAEEVTE